jgi:hypothetical protein
MRLDYRLYTLSVVFFVLTLVSAILTTGTNQTLWIIASGLLGILSLTSGFMQTPKTKIQINKLPLKSKPLKSTSEINQEEKFVPQNNTIN